MTASSAWTSELRSSESGLGLGVFCPGMPGRGMPNRLVRMGRSNCLEGPAQDDGLPGLVAPAALRGGDRLQLPLTGFDFPVGEQPMDEGGS